MMSKSPHFDTVLQDYMQGVARLVEALDGLTPAQLDLALDAENWGIRHIAHHIVDGDDLWGLAVKIALGNPKAVFSLPWYWEKPQMHWAEKWLYTQRSLETSLALFAANRAHIHELLRLSPDAWETPVLIRWPEGQEEVVLIAQIIESQVRHALGHIENIRRIRQMHGV